MMPDLLAASRWHAEECLAEVKAQGPGRVRPGNVYLLSDEYQGRGAEASGFSPPYESALRSWRMLMYRGFPYKLCFMNCFQGDEKWISD